MAFSFANEAEEKAIQFCFWDILYLAWIHNISKLQVQKNQALLR